MLKMSICQLLNIYTKQTISGCRLHHKENVNTVHKYWRDVKYCDADDDEDDVLSLRSNDELKISQQ